MFLLYVRDPLTPGQPDEIYRPEAEAATLLGLSWHLIDHDALVNDNDPSRAVRRVPVCASPVLGVYRGWMMSAEQYCQFYEALAGKGIHLLYDPAAYRRCHHLPESYATIEGYTPRSVWLPLAGELDMDQMVELLRAFGDKPVIVKDYVKSRKHEWDEACFIPSASDRAAVERVVHRFLELQGEELIGGLVFREFMEFEPLAKHSRSGMPLTREYRLFFLDGRLLMCTEYWEEGAYGGSAPPMEQFTALAGRVQSRFFTMDVARRLDGEWMVVELGDGQVAGMPERADVLAFYRSLKNWLG